MPSPAGRCASPAAFTLIELLIVVAIIAILAAIALPNMLEAQVRAKVARTRSDMRTVATAFEAYAVDNGGRYPPMHYVPGEYGGGTVYLFVPNAVTTPVAYISTKAALVDIFKPARPNDPGETLSSDGRFRDYYNYINVRDIDSWPIPISGFSTFPPRPRQDLAGGWELWSWGPDRESGPFYNLPNGTRIYIQYDPTNGTASRGDIRRTQFDTSGKMRGAQ